MLVDLSFFILGLSLGAVAPITGVSGGVIATFLFLSLTSMKALEIVYANAFFLFSQSAWNLFLLRKVSLPWAELGGLFAKVFVSIILGSLALTLFSDLSLIFILLSGFLPFIFLTPISKKFQSLAFFPSLFVLSGAGVGVGVSLSAFFNSRYQGVLTADKQVKSVFLVTLFVAFMISLWGLLTHFFVWSQIYKGSHSFQVYALTLGALIGSFGLKKALGKRQVDPKIRLAFLSLFAFLILGSCLFRLQNYAG